MEPKATPEHAEHAPETTDAIDLERIITAPETDILHLSEKVVDGDVALTILQTHFDPFTPEEEKRVRRKIDLRMIILMLLVNGLQYVDKNVSKSQPP
jgi:ACS family allantoate permease-like MFS transporter